MSSEQCAICYESMTAQTRFIVDDRCGHAVDKNCLSTFITTVIDSNKVHNIVCPFDHCRRQITESKLAQLLSDEYQKKLSHIRANNAVAISRGALVHCPLPDCEGLIDTKQSSMLQKMLVCDVCKSSVCAKCKQLAHEGESCPKPIEFQWDLIGNQQGGTASRCPECKSPFEKLDGCMHMECPMCKYQWCWMCGLPVDSFYHTGQGGGMICEIIGQSSFVSTRTGCERFLILILLFIMWPVLFFFLILQASAMGVFLLL